MCLVFPVRANHFTTTTKCTTLSKQPNAHKIQYVENDTPYTTIAMSSASQINAWWIFIFYLFCNFYFEIPPSFWVVIFCNVYMHCYCFDTYLRMMLKFDKLYRLMNSGSFSDFSLPGYTNNIMMFSFQDVSMSVRRVNVTTIGMHAKSLLQKVHNPSSLMPLL